MSATSQANSLALAWLSGYIHGSEAAAKNIQGYMADGVKLDRAALLAQGVCLSFCVDLANNYKEREWIVRLFRVG
jgi:hypothetical protein